MFSGGGAESGIDVLTTASLDPEAATAVAFSSYLMSAWVLRGEEEEVVTVALWLATIIGDSFRRGNNFLAS